MTALRLVCSAGAGAGPLGARQPRLRFPVGRWRLRARDRRHGTVYCRFGTGGPLFYDRAAASQFWRGLDIEAAWLDRARACRA